MLQSLASSHEAWQASGTDPAWMQQLRREMLERAQADGLPGKGMEAWKYTSTARLGRSAWVHDHGALFEALAAPHLVHLPGAAAEIVLVNGVFSHGLSSLGELAEMARPLESAVSARDLSRVLDPRRWEPLPDAARPGPPADGLTPDRVFDALNTAFLQGGLWLDVPAGHQVRGPIHVVHVAVGEGAPIAAHPRFRVQAGRGAGVVVVERHIAVGSQATFVNTVTDIVVEDGAQVEHHQWRVGVTNAHHVGRLRVGIGRDATARIHLAHLGAGWARQDVDVRFSGTGSELLCTDVVVAGGDSHVDHHTWVMHDAPRCTSRELVKGVYGGAARGVFDGLVVLARGAAKSDAELRAKNLIVSPGAHVHAKPELLIYADDVKAAHGCTVGQLDPTQVGYLRSRGIGHAAARALLTRGFLLDVLEEIADDGLREVTAQLVADALDVALREGA
jgi:Fe-S cluster assembly protein SufD